MDVSLEEWYHNGLSKKRGSLKPFVKLRCFFSSFPHEGNKPPFGVIHSAYCELRSLLSLGLFQFLCLLQLLASERSLSIEYCDANGYPKKKKFFFFFFF